MLELEVRWAICGQNVSGTGVLVDVSLGGACIRIDRVFSAKAGTTFELHAPDIPAMPSLAKLRWFRGVGRGQPQVLCGLIFLDQQLNTTHWAEWVRQPRPAMKHPATHYHLLHVESDAPIEIIHASYRTLMKRLRLHPDLGGDHGQAVLLNEAYATLSDPGRRAAYDLTLTGASRGHVASASPAAPATQSRPPWAAPPPNTVACVFCGAPFAPTRADCPDSACAACGSALAPAPRHEGNQQSRRAVERAPQNMPVTFHRSPSRHTTAHGTTKDISLNGMRLESRVSLSIGERVKIECTFCSAIAIVRSGCPDDRRRGSWEYGLEFLTLRIKHERGGLFSTVA